MYTNHDKVVSSVVLASIALLGHPAPGHAQCIEQRLAFEYGNVGSTSENLTGSSVAISGTTVVAGAPGANNGKGEVAIYEYNAAGLDFTPVDLSNPDATGWNEQFGNAVALDGDTLAVGARYHDGFGSPQSGAVYIYERIGGNWNLTQTLEPSSLDTDYHFGYSLDMDGDTLVVGAPGPLAATPFDGAAYVFKRFGGTWNLNSTLTPSFSYPQDNIVRFGFDVAVSVDRIVVGAPYAGDSGVVEMFAETPGPFVSDAVVSPSSGLTSDRFGSAVEVDDGLVLVGNPSYNQNAGRVHTYIRTFPGVWVEQQALAPSWHGDQFGFDIAIDGEEVLISAYSDSPGRAYNYDRSGNALTFTAELVPDGSLGAYPPLNGGQVARAVAVDGDLAILGAPGLAFSGQTTRVGGAFVWGLCGDPTETYCGLGQVNSTGAAAELTAYGSDSLTMNDITFTVSSVPAGLAGMFIMSQNEGSSQIMSGGTLCLLGPNRINGVHFADANGDVIWNTPLSPMPNVTLLAGETWRIQYWFRDVVGTLTSSAVSMTIKP